MAIPDGKIPTIDYLGATKIVVDNKASKKERAKKDTVSKIFENAVFIACQACDNLDDMKNTGFAQSQSGQSGYQNRHSRG
jgi:hypothetical protein